MTGKSSAIAKHAGQVANTSARAGNRVRDLDSALREAAEQALLRAYCPYSRFPVGAAVVTENGDVFTGVNVENASYGLTVCAERNAVFKAVGEGRRKIRAVVIVTGRGPPAPPCGACRQVISEFGSDIPITSYSSNGRVLRSNIRTLLPSAFGGKQLHRRSKPKGRNS